MPREQHIRDFYPALMAAWGPQDWWPARSRFEVIVGAFLTQNTAWVNVERALRNLRRAGALNPAGIRHLPLRQLERLVRPAGYFRQKARRLKNFVAYLDQRYGGSLRRMFARPTAELRGELLALNGVGPETADSILLYAGGHPVFVVDAYTRRVLDRHRLIPAGAKYEEVRELFERAIDEAAAGRMQVAGKGERPLPGRQRHKYVLPGAGQRARVFDEYHALLVQAAKHHCLKRAAQCAGCPLETFLPTVIPGRSLRPATRAPSRGH